MFFGFTILSKIKIVTLLVKDSCAFAYHYYRRMFVNKNYNCNFVYQNYNCKFIYKSFNCVFLSKLLM